MRELDIGTKVYTKVVCLDEPGQGGACHEYVVVAAGAGDALEVSATGVANAKTLARVSFQNGPVKEFGVNGCHNEDLIAIVIDRLEHFQKGDFNCHENALALMKLEEALYWLKYRTQVRIARGVEGTNTK